MNAFLRCCAVALMLAVSQAPAVAEDAPKRVTEKELLSHLEQITAWQRNILSIDTAPNNALEKLLKDTLQNSANKVLRYGFEFARAEALVLAKNKEQVQTVENLNTPGAQVAKTTAEITQRIATIQKEMAAIDGQIRRTASRNRTPLLIRREKLAGELKIANARIELMKSVSDLFNGKDSEDNADILDKINNLSLTIPGAAAKTKKSTGTTNTSAQTAAAAVTAAVTATVPVPAAAPSNDDDTQTTSRGMIGTSTDIFALYRKQKELAELSQETRDLRDNNKELMDNIRDTLQAAIQRGNDLTQSLDSVDPVILEAQRNRIDAIVGDFKTISTAVLPLGNVNVWLDASYRDLKEWRNSLDEQMSHLLRNLLVQCLLLGLAILIPVSISEAARRTIRHYVHESKKQRQLHIIRRTLFVIALILVIIMNFVSEFGSIVTFAGFLTAGIAVALQNVILSAVAHFFYFGRFGVRVGDRVTIKDVTGEVIQVGIIRLYLMELGGPDTELHPTGKIVAFPNSILFQNDAFSKHIAGADYAWQEITFILDPSSDYELANQKLSEAVNIVYTQYHDVMENQKRAITKSTHLDVTMPTPKGFLNFIDNGLAFIIRYPIQTSHVDEINQRITKELLAAIEDEPSLKIAGSTPPKIVAVDISHPPAA